MNLPRLVTTALAALCLVLGGGQRIAAADEDAYTVIIKKVEVKTTKADGSAWDVDNGKPDLAVKVRNYSEKGSKTFTTKTKDDTFSAEFDEPTTVKFRKGQTLEFEVVDVDVAVNDSIGKLSKDMGDDLIKKGKLAFENFGQVIRLEIEVKKVSGK